MTVHHAEQAVPEPGRTRVHSDDHQAVAPTRGDDATTPLGRGRMTALQRSAGNRAVTNVVQRDGPVHVVEEPIVVTSPVERTGGFQGAAADQLFISSLHTQWRSEISRFHSNWDDGLENFETAMSFASAQEAEADYVGAASSAAASALLDYVLGAVGTAAGSPALAAALSGLKSVGEALYDEHQRAAQAGGEFTIGQTIHAARELIGRSRTEMLSAHNSSLPTLLSEYHEAAGPDQGTDDESHVAVVGAAAEWVSNLRSAVEDFTSAVPDSNTFQLRITEGFADTPGLTDVISQGGRESGVLNLDLHVVRTQEDGEWTWQVTEVDSHWELATTAAEPERVAQSLANALSGRPPATASRLGKLVHVKVETEIDWGLNEYDDTAVYFIDPSSPEFRGWQPALSRTVWEQPAVRRAALGVVGLRGSGE